MTSSTSSRSSKDIDLKIELHELLVGRRRLSGTERGAPVPATPVPPWRALVAEIVDRSRREVATLYCAMCLDFLLDS